MAEPVTAAVVAAAANVAQAISQVIPLLNGARSALIQIDNLTDATWTRVRHHNDHGGFAATPSFEIPPKHSNVFGSQDLAFSVGTGTDGHVVYNAGATELTVFWDVPFIGANGSSATVSGGHLALFRANTITGAGNEKAHMRYEVFERAQPSWRFCEKCFVMFFDGFPEKGVCPKGGGHSPGRSFNFVIPHDTPEPGQRDWRFCKNCFALFFAGFPARGVCP